MKGDYFYAVIGRMCGDDEDSVCFCEARNRDGAVRKFRRQILNGADFRSARSMLKENMVFVNTVLISRTPIRAE